MGEPDKYGKDEEGAASSAPTLSYSGSPIIEGGGASFGNHPMNILVLNAGSSSLKYKLFAMPAEDVLAEGNSDTAPGDSAEDAAAQVISECQKWGIDAVGHRVVHGGPRFSAPVCVTPDVLTDLKALKDLDPLHSPIETTLIEAGQRLLPGIPAVAAFDTAFHRTLPEVAWRYGLPRALTDRLHLRRCGFHGLSYQYVTGRLLACLGREAEGTRLIVCHLGSGASVCAVKDGLSVDTSMGLTPLEGLLMGTRSGDIDPGLLLYLLRSQSMTAEDLDALLNHDSGLKGVGGQSDVRKLEQAASGGDADAEMALEMFAYRAAKYIGAYAAALEGVDAVAFTGGIGQHSSEIRARLCRRLAFVGIGLDRAANAAAGPGEVEISPTDAPVSVWMIPTDEERQIAREAFALLLPA